MNTLPNRRHAERFKFMRGNRKFYGTAGYADEFAQEPCEIFLQGGKAGSELEAACRDFAVAISKALEYGAPFEELRMAMTRLDDGSEVSRAAGAGGMFLDEIAKAARSPKAAA